MHPTTFEYLNPTDQQKERMQMTRDAAKAYAKILDSALPEGPDKTYIFRELRSLAMWCNVAITRHPDGAPRQDPQ